MSRGADVVREYWARIEARDWDGVRDLLAPDVVVEWTATGERFTGPDEVVRVNQEYPEGWEIHVRSIMSDGDRVVSDVEVPVRDGATFRVAAFMKLADGKLESSTEYWIEVGGEQPPDWRRP